MSSPTRPQRRSTRRSLLKDFGLPAALFPFIGNLPSLAAEHRKNRKQRLVVFFSPNGIVPKAFWPTEIGAEFALKEILSPLESLKKQTLILNGVADKIRGDGDAHMRGIGCLLTGVELYPGNVQGGSDTPAGWAKGISIDQEIKNFLQASDATRTRFGSFEIGALVPDRADTWTRLSYAGANKPLAPIDDPYQFFARLYGRGKDQAVVASILDDIHADLKRLGSEVGSEDRKLLDEHAQFVREMERDLAAESKAVAVHRMPELDPGVRENFANLPKITKMQLDLLTNSFLNDFARIATFQFSNSVGGLKMSWLGIEEGHHELSHEPDSNIKAQEKLIKINKWYCEQIAEFARKLAATPEPGGQGSLLDNTTIVWTNELGKGNSHTLDDIPFVLIGGGLHFKMGRSLRFRREPHNRLLLSIAHGFGHNIPKFGNPDQCAAGPFALG